VDGANREIGVSQAAIHPQVVRYREYAWMRAMFRSPSLATAPSRVTLPFFTMMPAAHSG
jgi:hypothetical protein